MGLTITLQSGSGQECPLQFTQSDSKGLGHYLLARHVWRIELPDFIGRIGQALSLDLAPLGKVASEDPDLGEYLKAYRDEPGLAKERYNRDKQAYKAAWQPPEQLANCLGEFVRALDENPDVYAQVGIEQGYFINGIFKGDLSDLQRMAEWYAENGESKVRLFWLM